MKPLLYRHPFIKAISAMKNYPKISIITTVKNGAPTLEKAIQSLTSQNYPNLEYIVMDGNSSDETIDVIKRHQNHITYWHSGSDGGAADAANTALKKATGQIISFLNADDFYEENSLFKIADEFIKNPSLDIVSLCYRVIKKDGETYKIIEETTPHKMTLDKNQLIISYGSAARFFKKDLFEKYGDLIIKDDQNRIFVSNDVEFMIRILLKGITNKTLDYIGYNYLAHEKSLTFSQNLDTQIRLNEDKIFIAKIFLNSNDFYLPKIWQKTFRKWIKKYRARIVKLQFKQRKYKEVYNSLIAGVKDSGFLQFIIYLIKTICRK